MTESQGKERIGYYMPKRGNHLGQTIKFALNYIRRWEGWTSFSPIPPPNSTNFLWKRAEDVNVEKLKEELADVFIYAFLLAKKHDLDIRDIVINKIRINSEKYPTEKAKNSAKKYHEL